MRLEDDAPPNLTLDQLAGDASAHVFTLDDSTLLASGIPGLYTQAGYHQVVKKKLSLLLTGADGLLTLPIVPSRLIFTPPGRRGGW